MKYASFNINFDSLAEAYGYPTGYRDKSYKEVSGRFLDLAREFGFKYTIFVIGKDLEEAGNKELVREWALEGHEIGNHSWSHALNLGAMSEKDIQREVGMAHDIITETTGCEPRGFIAPNWCTSSTLLKVLIEMGYSYDTSSFPSWISYLALLKILANHLGDMRFLKTFQRRDLLCPILGQRDFFYSKGSIYCGSPEPASKKTEGYIRILPIPTNAFGIACWHTMLFILGWNLHKKLLKSCLAQLDAFYYVMHPADFIDRDDLDPEKRIHWERLDVPLQKKADFLRRSIELILESGRQIVTMQELALHCQP